jgi:hypothetical protein
VGSSGSASGASSGAACIPEGVSAACGNLQCGHATDNCGQTVNCGVGGTAACPMGAMCLASGTCCTPKSPCAGRCGGATLTDNCGGMVQCSAACPSAQVCSGTSCVAACSADRAKCKSQSDCCSGACANNGKSDGFGTCASACVVSGGTCTVATDACCYPLTCQLPILQTGLLGLCQ